MKNKDLVKILQKLNPDIEVCFLDFSGRVTSVNKVFIGEESINKDYSFIKTKHYLLYSQENISTHKIPEELNNL